METSNFFLEIKTVSTITHVFSSVVGMGAALMGDFLFNFYSKDSKLDRSETKTLKILSTIVWLGLLAIAFSGMMLFLSDTERYLDSDKFLAKMTILAVLVINGFFLSKKIWPKVIKDGFFTNPSERRTRKLAFACGAISLVSWVLVLSLGVLDKSPFPYKELVGIYMGILVIAIITSLIIEKRKFN